jgi:nucleotide-binding universal stress UspA family protein
MQTILLAIDDSEYSRVATDDIVEHMRPDAVTVHVLHVLELEHVLPSAFDFARGSAYGADVAAHVHSGHEAAERLVNEAAGRLQQTDFHTTTAIREGDPRHEILDYASEIDCDCIVMGSHGRRGMDRFFMGSVSDAVARHAHCSVHIVRVRRR